MKKKILGLILAFGVALGALVPSGAAFADPPTSQEPSESCKAEFFLGLRPWYYNLLEEGSCEIRHPTGCTDPKAECSDAGNKLAGFIWQIVLNVLIDLFIVAGVVAVGFLIYGGYLYLRSGGDPNFAAKGRKVIISSLVGLAIVTLANVASRLIETILGAASENGGWNSSSIQAVLNWVYIIMGMVAVGGIVFGAVSWTTSQGDPAKVKKGKDAILYAIIGLVIVLLAVAITNLVIGATAGQ